MSASVMFSAALAARSWKYSTAGRTQCVSMVPLPPACLPACRITAMQIRQELCAAGPRPLE